MRLKLKQYLPKVLPAAWQQIPPPVAAREMKLRCAAFQNTAAVKVIMSLDDYENYGGVWLHISVSQAGGLPSWSALKETKALFLGNRVAIQLFPPKEHWVSVAECLHLFSRLDKDVVPPVLWERR